MKRSQMLCIAFLLLGACHSTTIVQKPVRNELIASWMVPHTVKVSISCPDGSGGGGSAVLLDSKHALTARHVVDEVTPDCDIVLENFLYKVEVAQLVLDNASDLAYLTLASPVAIQPVDMVQGKLGDHVVVVGYPTNLSSERQMLNVTDGIVAAHNYVDNEDRITAQVYFGNSGGPVFNDQGELVGIAVALFARRLEQGWPIPYDGVALMVPYRYMAALVRESGNTALQPSGG